MRPVLIRMLEGRVGSTLLMQLLGTSRAVTFEPIYPFEQCYLTYFVRLLAPVSGPPADEDEMVRFLDGVQERVGPLPFPAELIDTHRLAQDGLRALWEALSAQMQPAQWYAEKYLGDLAPVIEAGLDPVVIDLVRDPRDIVASIRGFNTKFERDWFGRGAAGSDREHVRRMAAGMSMRLREFERPVAATRILIRYEELIDDLDLVATRLTELLGATFDPAAARDGVALGRGHVTAATPQQSIGRWVRDLPQDEIDLIERRLGPQIQALGYTISV